VPSQAGHRCSVGLATRVFIQKPFTSRVAQRGPTGRGQCDKPHVSRPARQRADGLRCTARRVRDHDLGAIVAAQMYEVCDRLPAHVAQAALARYGFVDAGMVQPERGIVA
jgi:hypothetical protein